MKESNSVRTKVAFVISSNLKEWAGMEHTLYEYVKNKPDNVDVTIVQPNKASKERVDSAFINARFKDAKIVSIDDKFGTFSFMTSTRIGYAFNELFIVPTLALLDRLFFLRGLYVKIGSPDIIYFFNSDRGPRLFKKIEGVVFIGSEHGWSFAGGERIDFFKKIQNALVRNRLIFRNIDIFHIFPARSDLLKRGIRGFALPNGVETDMFKPVGRGIGDVKLLFFGRLERCKGIPIILETWKRVKEIKGIHLTIAGKGSMEREITSVKDENFTYLGFVEEAELPSIINKCDLLIYPSGCDNFSLVTLQSLCSGLTVITNKYISSNFSEFVELGQIKVVENIASSYVKSIDDFIKEGPNFSRDQSYDICKNNYDWKNISLRLYQEMFRSLENLRKGDRTYGRT
ncbi:MAG: glycosyltransferase family 4 protein [Nitrososphaerota archaeon]